MYIKYDICSYLMVLSLTIQDGGHEEEGAPLWPDVIMFPLWEYRNKYFNF